MNYKDVIESKYNREAWQHLLHDIFQNKVSFWSNPSSVQVSSTMAKEALYLGKITLSDGESIAVYEVELSDKVDIERNRRGVRDMLTKDWKDMGYVGAFMFCYRKNESVLRFSYVSETFGFNSKGEYEARNTNTKRYTYLLGEGRGCRTAIEQFGVLKNSKQTLDDITAAFSVEALTKQFYKDLFDWYQWAIGPDCNVRFPDEDDNARENVEIKETKIIRMITRIMFVWFIKQKELVPNKIFNIEYLKTILKDFDPLSETVGNYYNAILQNLFFATLNRAIEDENGEKRRFATNASKDIKTLYRYAEMFSIKEEEVIELFSEIPFLNGGLFECLDKTKKIDGVEKAYNYDGFSRNDKTFPDGRYRNRAVVPNLLFFDQERGLISILNRYNFTIEENSPEEQQVALDPELLGKVFENLLGAYNPETQETARNQSGSFYTPREIVNYMVDESLIAYLGDSSRDLFKDDFKFDSAKQSEYKAIADKLKAIKILDPACGSGAFPMGLLNRMVDVLQRISPDERVYDLKLSIIENCIYGSDIQSIAVQISKLRFFISLICNCEKDTTKPNFGIPTLPNLETKFVAANSLIEKKKRAAQYDLFENPEIESTKKELGEVRHRHFSAKTAYRKEVLRKEDERLRQKMAQLLADEHAFLPEDAKQLAAWNPYDQNAVSPFFDSEWMFGITDGFDIVIGNPPYVQLQNNGGKFAALYENCGYDSFARTGDIYCLFYERGWQLLNQDGLLCYITSNKWMRAGYGEKLRKFLVEKTNPKQLIDFAGVKIFESATVDTNILLFQKSANEHKTQCVVTDKQNKDGVKNLSDFVQHTHTVCDFATSDSWVILSPIEQSIKRKIEAVGTPLKDWDIQINYGIKTGFNDAFIINTDKRNEILNNCADDAERARTDELIRPILRGRDIKRYGYDWADLWLINTHNGIKGKLERIHIEDYPAVKDHLGQYWDKIATRADKGDTPYNLRNCAYMEDFLKPKVMWKIIGCNINFSFDDTAKICNNAVNIMTGNKSQLLQFVGLMNSKLFDWYLKLTTEAEVQGGGIQLYVTTLEKTLLKLDFPQELSMIIEDRLNGVCSDSDVDETIFNAYNLTNEEADYILSCKQVNRQSDTNQG